MISPQWLEVDRAQSSFRRWILEFTPEPFVTANSLGYWSFSQAFLRFDNIVSAMKGSTCIATALCSQQVLSGSAPGSSLQQVVPGNQFGRPGKNATFDYVVVGGGTAGLAMAYRLAEDGTNTVAVIEAGGFYEQESGNTSVVPAYNQDYNYITPDSQYDEPLVDWGFLTSPQAGAMDQKFHYGRGKMLGGCSAENAMNYNRPTTGSLNMWADAVNDTSYTWENFAPFFKSSVTYSNPNSTIRASNASVPMISENGTAPLQVSFPHWASPMSSWAQLALREIGIPDIHSIIEGELAGSQYSPLTLNPEDQTRSSSQTSYLNAALESGRTNLQVYTHALAKQVLFNQNKTATSVLVQSGHTPTVFELTAKREVIVSAGAFQSPQLLMVSGIGPAQQLKEHNITVIADRPGVGQSMWDHVVLSVGRQVDVETYGRLSNVTLATQAEANYAHQRGILTNDQSDYLAFEKLPYRSSFTAATNASLAKFASDFPEVEYELSIAPFGTPSFSTPENPIDVGYIQPVLISPLSRGNVTISSADMSDPPIINPNWLTDPADQQVAVEAFKRGRQFFNTSAIAPILIGDELSPGQDLPDGSSDEEILKYIQTNIGFNWHASCTCKMGRLDDPMAVVDSHAKVIGVNNLRVVDASAFPLLPPGHPQSVVYALAEKIAADVLSGR
ncbi:Patulin synthase [Pseudocercospora fuligena]|uniref:Patulin synthase n=1 Tax=Pseudocercospora fuligena TaxID=685502 RepID=A0A8H6RQZ4_9PEZI|nr:Patulin synthase [Pseudocercospora fuligena]